MEKRSWKARAAYWAFAVGLFACMMLFFAKIHPLMMHDGDDWGYMAYTRWATPIWGYWNPTRILPETFMPLITYIAGYAVMPFVSDFCWSAAYAYGAVVSAFIVAYALGMGRLLRRKFGLPQWAELLMCALFVMLHFLAFRSQRTNNDHLFYCWSANTYFFYMIPALLNACLVLLFAREDGIKCGPLGLGAVVLLVYFAVMSNLLASYTLAIYCGMLLLEKLTAMIRSRQSLRAFVRENLWILAILALWLTMAVFEFNGARSEALDVGEPFFDRFKTAVQLMLERLTLLNGWFLGVCIVCVLAGVALAVRSGLRTQRDRAYVRLCIRFGACALISALYVALVCAKAAPGYSKRTDVIIGIAFFCLMIAMISAAYVIGRFPRAGAALPLLLCLLFFETDTRWTTFLESNISNLPARECAEINNAMIGQIIEADRAGASEVHVLVPDGPYPYYMADGIARTLLKCGLIDRAIPEAYIVVDDALFYETYDIWGHDEAAREALEAMKTTEETP